MTCAMAEELKRYFLQLAKTVEGIHAIIVTDKEGVPVLKVPVENFSELAMKPHFLSTAAMAMDQAGKLGVSATRHIVTLYDNHQVVSLNHHPFIVNIIADAEANTGLVLGLETDMDGALSDIVRAVNGTVS